MKNRIYYIMAFLIIFISAFCVVVVHKYNNKKVMLGSYVFAKVIPDMDSVSYISIQRDDRRINLQLKDGLWRVAEADDYYANYALLNGLFTDVYNSQYSSQVEDLKGDLFSNPISLEFKNNQGKVIENIVLGGKDKKYLYNFAKMGEQTFLITGKFVLPLEILSWLQNPAFKFQDIDVLYLQIVEKNGKIKEIEAKETPIEFYDYLGFLHFNNAISEANFDKTDVGEEKSFIIASTEGLEMTFTIFPKGENFWAKIKIGTTRMPTVEANEFVKNNAFLYEGWIFELPQDYGKMIYRFLSGENNGL